MCISVYGVETQSTLPMINRNEKVYIVKNDYKPKCYINIMKEGS